MSFWYLANRLRRRFLRHAQDKIGQLEQLGPGLWRGELLRRPVYFVSAVDLPVEEDTLPLHIIAEEPLETERHVARLIADVPKLQRLYGGWMASLHPAAWKEVEEMARTRGRGLVLDVRPAIESLGLKHVIEQVGLDRVIDEVGLKRVVDEVGVKRVIDEVGSQRVLDELSEREIIKHVGLDRWLANLSPSERRELKRRMEQI